MSEERPAGCMGPDEEGTAGAACTRERAGSAVSGSERWMSRPQGFRDLAG